MDSNYHLLKTSEQDFCDIISATDSAQDWEFSEDHIKEIARILISYVISDEHHSYINSVSGDNAYRKLNRCVKALDGFYPAWNDIAQNPYILAALKEMPLPIQQDQGWAFKFLEDLHHLHDALMHVQNLKTLDQPYLPNFQKKIGAKNKNIQRELILKLSNSIYTHLNGNVTTNKETSNVIREVLNIININLTDRRIENILSQK